jgi:hypothetical protein
MAGERPVETFSSFGGCNLGKLFGLSCKLSGEWRVDSCHPHGNLRAGDVNHLEWPVLL